MATAICFTKVFQILYHISTGVQIVAELLYGGSPNEILLTSLHEYFESLSSEKGICEEGVHLCAFASKQSWLNS